MLLLNAGNPFTDYGAPEPIIFQFKCYSSRDFQISYLKWMKMETSSDVNITVFWGILLCSFVPIYQTTSVIFPDYPSPHIPVVSKSVVSPKLNKFL